MTSLRTHWASLVLALSFIGLLGLTPFGGTAHGQGTSVAPDDPSLTLTYSRGSYSAAYSGGGGDQVGSMPDNLVAATPAVAVIKTGKPGLEFRVTQCPNETDEHFFDRVDDFSHKVWARFGEPPVITPGG
jgi:hypothetical protein